MSRLTVMTANTIWQIVTLTFTFMFLSVVLYFIHYSIVNKLPLKKMQFWLLLSLLFQAVSVVIIGNNPIRSEQHNTLYYILEFTSSVLILYPSIMILITICDRLNNIQTLSHTLFFKIVCILFIFLDICARIYCVLYLIEYYPINKWIFGVMISWSTIFITLIILLFMIRSESVDCFNYIKDVIDPAKKTETFHHIVRLNFMCFSFVIYCILILFQICIEMFGYNEIWYIIGLYNQWILANTLLLSASLYCLKPLKNTLVNRNYSSNYKQTSKFTLLDDKDINIEIE
eukprot:475779_1